MKYTREFFEELEDDTEIKKFRLEEEWARQPQRYLKYAMASAYFQKRASEQEQSAKVLHATLKADAAEDPDACLGQGVKPTGDRCESYATQHPEYKKAKHWPLCLPCSSARKHLRTLCACRVWNFIRNQKPEMAISLTRPHIGLFQRPSKKDAGKISRAGGTDHADQTGTLPSGFPGV